MCGTLSPPPHQSWKSPEHQSHRLNWVWPNLYLAFFLLKHINAPSVSFFHPVSIPHPPPSYTHPFIPSLFFSCLSLPPWQSSILSLSIEAALENSERPVLKGGAEFLLNRLNPPHVRLSLIISAQMWTHLVKTWAAVFSGSLFLLILAWSKWIRYVLS